MGWQDLTMTKQVKFKPYQGKPNNNNKWHTRHLRNRQRIEVRERKKAEMWKPTPRIWACCRQQLTSCWEGVAGNSCPASAWAGLSGERNPWRRLSFWRQREQREKADRDEGRHTDEQYWVTSTKERKRRWNGY